jgi:hypothetical protein
MGEEMTVVQHGEMQSFFEELVKFGSQFDVSSITITKKS